MMLNRKISWQGAAEKEVNMWLQMVGLTETTVLLVCLSIHKLLAAGLFQVLFGSDFYRLSHFKVYLATNSLVCCGRSDHMEGSGG